MGFRRYSEWLTTRKTSWGPLWLDREITRTCDLTGGQNDYIAVTSSYDLFKLKLLPELQSIFEHVTGQGRYWSGLRVIELKDPRTGKFWARRADDTMWGRIILRSASSGGGLESSTSRGAWLDECGMSQFELTTFEAVLRRLSLFGGRVLGTTTLYDLGWLHAEVWDKFIRVGTDFEKKGDSDHNVINFDSTENPAFPEEEFERARQSMPLWRFNMFYRGIFTRPAGQIYDNFVDVDISEGGHRMRPVPVPKHWHRVMGIDFGVVHTCVGLYAVEEDDAGYPTGRLRLYRTYFAGSRNATDHVAALRLIEPNIMLATGGAASEDNWRQAFLWAGLPVYQPTFSGTDSVEVGIDRMFGVITNNNLVVHDTERDWIGQVTNYARELDDNGQPTVKILNKAAFHHMDASRYGLLLYAPTKTLLPWVPRRHLLVGEWGSRTLPTWWRRFGGLRYREGEPACFVLMAIDEDGNTYAEGEIVMPGLSPSEMAKKIRALIDAKLGWVDPAGKKQPYAKVKLIRIGCNPEMFTAPPTPNSGMIAGVATVEAFRRIGLSCIEVNADGVNEWSNLKNTLVRMNGLRVQRMNCPWTALTLPLIVSHRDYSDRPDDRGPIAAGQAVCYALATRPGASRMTVAEKDAEAHLPHALRTGPKEKMVYE